MPELISLLAPTRGRPQALLEMADTAFGTAEGPVEVLAYVDDDDPQKDVYLGLGIRIVIGPRIILSNCWNQLAHEAQGDILHMSSDDIRFRTAGWDRIIRDTFNRYEDRIVFVWGRDGIHDGIMGTHGFISRRWMETVGYFTWPDFPADYADTWLDDLANRIGRSVYLPELLIEHLHPIAKKAEYDQTHRERLERGRRANVKAMWRRLESQRKQDAERLGAACFSSPAPQDSSVNI